MTTVQQELGTFAQEWRRWHEDTQARLAAPHGVLSITALHWLDEEPRRFAGVPGEWSAGRDGTAVDLRAGEVLSYAGRPLAGHHVFGLVLERAGLVASYGRTELEIAHRGGYDILRPRHPDNPLRRSFAGTPTFAPDPAWRVVGRFRPFRAPRATAVGSVVDGLEHVYASPGVVELELGSRVHRLTAFEGATPGSLFLLFTDETSGVTTYAAGRALDVDAPGPDGSLVVDLNRARNLPCAYTDLATCPLPPPGNRLPVAVEAGDQIPWERQGQR